MSSPDRLSRRQLLRGEFSSSRDISDYSPAEFAELMADIRRDREEQEADPEYLAYLDEGWLPEQIEINGVTIDLNGVAHHPRTLEQHAPELRESIQAADIALVEGAPRAQQELSDEQLRLTQTMYREVFGINYSIAQLREIEKDNENLQFFGGVEALAAQVRTPLAVCDARLTDLYALEDKQAEIERQKALLALLTMSPAGLAVAMKILYKKDSPEGGNRRNISRREMLAGSAALLGVIPLASIAAQELEPFTHRSVANFFEKLGMRDVYDEMLIRATPNMEIGGVVDNPLYPFLYDIHDYRDLLWIEALHELSSRQGISRISCIAGRRHTQAIQAYAELSPERRARALALYAPFQRIAAPEIRMYGYDETASDWNQTETISLVE